MFKQIPDELKTYRQWVNWRAEDRNGKQTKLPYSPHTGALASVTDPSTWGSFDDVVRVAPRYANGGIGFVLTENDPFAFIDLDDPSGDASLIEQHTRILDAFKSYAEYSPSRRGMHIIVRGAVPDGKRKNKIELYSSERYMTMTGDISRAFPIAERQEQVTELYKYLAPVASSSLKDIQERAEIYSDKEIYDRASAAPNGTKFLELWNGRYQSVTDENGRQRYTSQSEADFALVDILGFYSRNRTQIMRMFRMSTLGRRDKAQRDDYVLKMAERSFDNHVVTDFTALKESFKTGLAERERALQPGTVSEYVGGEVHTMNADGIGYNHLPVIPASPIRTEATNTYNPYTPPPGLIGDVARYIHDTAFKPVPEIALAGALAFMAGICGRQWNTHTGLGLALYIVLLAPTGTGKEGAQAGISRLFRAITTDGGVPAADVFEGPGGLASGQALLKALVKQPCCVSIIGEIGGRFKRMCAPNAPQSEQALIDTLRDLYNKSGASDSKKATVYADSDKNVPVIYAPNYTFLGEGVPDEFYGSLTDGAIASGLLPRFSIIEYTGGRVKSREDEEFSRDVPPELLDRLAKLAAFSLGQAHKNTVIVVQHDEAARKILRDFREYAEDKVFSNKSMLSELWNRAHMKALKLAALIAVGCNPYEPTVNAEAAQWACNFINHEISLFVDKFERGEIGVKDTDEARQLAEVKRAALEYASRSYSELSKYLAGAPQAMHTNHIIPVSYFQRRLSGLSCMRNDRIGAKAAISRAIDTLVKSDALRPVDLIKVSQDYGRSMQAYALVDAASLS